MISIPDLSYRSVFVAVLLVLFLPFLVDGQAWLGLLSSLLSGALPADESSDTFSIHNFKLQRLH